MDITHDHLISLGFSHVQSPAKKSFSFYHRSGFDLFKDGNRYSIPKPSKEIKDMEDLKETYYNVTGETLES